MFSKSNNKKRGNFKRKRMQKKKTGYLNSLVKRGGRFAANAALTLAKRQGYRLMARMICNKYKDFSANSDLGVSGIISTTGNYLELTNISQSDLTYGREGVAIHMKSIYYSISLSATATTRSLVRLVFVKAKGGVDLTSVATFKTDLVDTGGGYPGSILYGPIDHNKFEILVDRFITLYNLGDSTIQHVQDTIQLNSLRILFAENSNTASMNRIFAFVIASNSDGTTDIGINGFIRVLFTDG